MVKKYKVKGAAESGPLGTGRPFGNNGRISSPNFVIIGSSNQAVGDKELVENIRRYTKDTPIIMIAGDVSENQMKAALDISLGDMMGLPTDSESVINCFRQLEQAVNPHPILPAELLRGDFVVGRSVAMKKIMAQLDRIALTDSNVLITGETGTGKDMVAEYIHSQSRRKSQSLVCVNCTALPDSLLESELFGHEKGAFTHAVATRLGKFEMASGSTLFLDEIGDMGRDAQAKILRTIEKKEFWRIGGNRPIISDFRLITATNRDLESLVDKGTFREDLFYRLNIVRVHLPPLRERKEDIEPLARLAVRMCNRKFGRALSGLNPQVLERFLAFDWPGNVRQLNNVIEAAYINGPSGQLTLDDLPEAFLSKATEKQNSQPYEAYQISRALKEAGNNKTQASKKLNMSRMTLYRKMASYNIPLK